MYSWNRSLAVFLTLSACRHVCHSTPGWIDGIKLKDILTDLVEGSLGAVQFQDIIDKQPFIQSKLDGESIIDLYVQEIGGYLNNTFLAVERIRSVLEEDYLENKYKTGIRRIDDRQCCLTDDSDYVYSNEFMTKISTSEMCLRLSKDAEDDSLVPLSERLRDVMKRNRNDEKAIKWQYYGTEEGVFVKYPRQKDSVCDMFDPRYRPWYAETVASRPKDIVIVFDRSGSIKKKGLMFVVKNSALALIQTLNHDDRIAMVAFNSIANSPPGETGRTCYYNKLAFATPDNKDYLTRWLTTIEGHGTSSYRPALEKAFGFFKNSGDVQNDPRSRRRVIVFLSDGVQDWTAGDDGGILELIRQRNAELNNTVLITTYGIGTDMSLISQDIMRNMSLQTLADLSKGPITSGQFIRIRSSDNLRSVIGSYYNRLKDFSNGKPSISALHVDFTGLGLIASVCLPVYPDGKLLGVTCIDLSLIDILTDVINLHSGLLSYAFITDYKSGTIIHPLMPRPLNYGTVIYLDINDLERDQDVKAILKQMKSGNSGKKTFTKEFVKPRGNTTTDGVRTLKMTATYFWKHIDGAPFNVAVVTTNSDVNINLQQTGLSSDNFIYHRLDLVENIKKCNSHGRLSTKEHSVVKLTDAAFKKKLYYNEPDTQENVNIYTVYFEDESHNDHDRLKLITKQMIGISEKLEKIWKDQRQLDDVIVWRYYGDYYGHVRIYPGLTLPKNYDHTQRAFFWKSVNNEDLITITPPYLDAFGAGVVTTVARPIFLKGANSANNPFILGLAALDIKTNYIKYIVEETFKSCLDDDKSCFIMDSSGYLIYHSEGDYNINSNTKEVYSYHITEMEPAVSIYLINHGYLVSESCMDFGYKKEVFTWRLNIGTSINSFDKSPYFDMVKVSGTNVYLGIKKRGLKVKCECPDRNTPDYGVKMYQCEAKQGHCGCPCVEEAKYDHCKNEFLLSIAGPPACVPQPHSLGFKSPIPNEQGIISRLPLCYNYNCSAKLKESSCRILEMCFWCADTTKCGKEGCPTRDTISASQKTVVVAAATAATVIGILLIVATTLLVLRKRLQCPCFDRGKTPQPGMYMPEDSIPTTMTEEPRELTESNYLRQQPYISQNKQPDVIGTEISTADYEEIYNEF